MEISHPVCFHGTSLRKFPKWAQMPRFKRRDPEEFGHFTFFFVLTHYITNCEICFGIYVFQVDFSEAQLLLGEVLVNSFLVFVWSLGQKNTNIHSQLFPLHEGEETLNYDIATICYHVADLPPFAIPKTWYPPFHFLKKNGGWPWLTGWPCQYSTWSAMQVERFICRGLLLMNFIVGRMQVFDF